jgi:hypothetical protein
LRQQKKWRQGAGGLEETLHVPQRNHHEIMLAIKKRHNRLINSQDITCDVLASRYYAMFGQCFLLTAESGDSEQVYKGSIVLVGIKLFSIQKGTTSHYMSQN